MSALRDDSREAFEASFYDRGDFEEDAPSIEDVEDEERYERSKSLYRCTDRMCGALDCSNCYPASFDANPDEEESNDGE